jgi:predicted DNA-binding protein YlxM (UPF0122 family)
MDKNVRMSILFEIYGNILTNKQAETVELYYNDNLSLAEIAENLNITRQGVRENLVKAEGKMLEMEEKLGLLKKKQEREKLISEIISEIDNKNIKEKILKLM